MKIEKTLRFCEPTFSEVDVGEWIEHDGFLYIKIPDAVLKADNYRPVNAVPLDPDNDLVWFDLNDVIKLITPNSVSVSE